MELTNVVPWGRSYGEYVAMFSLSELDLAKSILGCGDGPASFNAELTQKGGSVVSIDPTYVFSAGQLRTRIAQVYSEIMPQMEQTQGNYLWDTISSVEALGDIRMAAMETFLADYEQGKHQNRYLEAALPHLPFQDNHFDLAVCSHYLFLYSTQVDLQQHLDALTELTRVANEVRVYPLVTLKGEQSPHLQPVLDYLSQLDLQCQLIDSQYQFQKGATKTLVVKRFT